MTLLSTISKWGNGQGIRLPKTLLELLKWENNDKLEIIIENENIRIKKIDSPKKRKNIKELFANYEKEYQTQEIDWGKPEGKEIW